LFSRSFIAFDLGLLVDINIIEPVSTRAPVPSPGEIRDTCLCFHVQRAARALARRFDAVFRPLELTHGQFSLLNALNRKGPSTMAEVSEVLAMDRTTLTANLKPLERRGLVAMGVVPNDRRSKRIDLTPSGRGLLREAIPLWKRAHAELDRELGGSSPARLRSDLAKLR
jgi:DNA-binding MarR family transcriptional regulator